MWIQIIVKNGIKLFVSAYYRPHISDHVIELNTSLSKLHNVSMDAKIWLAGDFNTPNINWDTMTVAKNAPYSAAQSSLIKTMQEHSLEQIVNQPTRIIFTEPT